MTRLVHVNDHTIEVRNPDKVLFPDAEVTKWDLVDYYRQIAGHMVPLIRERPLVMHRWPDGVDEDGFWTKRVPKHFPDWLESVSLDRRSGGEIHQVVCNDAPTLVYLASQAVVVPHVWLTRADRPEYPDQLVFDLDPSTEDVGPVRAAAEGLRDVLDSEEIPSFVKSSGSRGLHVHVPIERRWRFEETRAAAAAIAQRVVDMDPGAFTLEVSKKERGKRLFIDILRNGYAQHVVAPYALRARPGAPVAMPLDWSEALEPSFDPRRWRVDNAFRRLAQKNDPWADIEGEGASLDAVLASR